MTAHTHTVITDGCYRCDLNKDEVRAAESDMLREAAALMRERAEAAYPSPWWPYDRFTYTGIWSAPAPDASGRQVGTGRTAENGEHIASWHPAVALAVADWLAGHADLEDRNHAEMGWSPVDITDALAVARAYLGEEL